MAKFRYHKIMNNRPSGWIKYGEGDAMGHIVDLSDEDLEKTDVEKRAIYAARILENEGVTLDPSEDINVVQVKIDSWLEDSSTATTEEILADTLSLLRDKGII